MNQLQYCGFQPWIDISKINWESYKDNDNATYYFNSNRDNINWRTLYPNHASLQIPCRIELDSMRCICLSDIEFEYANGISHGFSLSFLMDNITHFDIYEIMAEMHAVQFTVYYLEHCVTFLTDTHWKILSRNYHAINFLLLNEDKINWDYLSLNRHRKAIELLERNPDKINWNLLSKNSSAIHLLEKNWDKIDWEYLSLNSNAVHILEKNQDKIDWALLSLNPAAMKLLQANQDKIHWPEFSANSSINRMYWDYCKMKEKMDIVREGLISYFMHPKRLQKWIDMGGDIDDF